MALASASSLLAGVCFVHACAAGRIGVAGDTVRTLSIRRPIGDAPEAEPEPPLVTASLGNYQAREPAYEQQTYEHRLAAAPSIA